MSLLWFLVWLWFLLTGLISIFGLHFDNQAVIMGLLALVIGILGMWSIFVRKPVTVP